MPKMLAITNEKKRDAQVLAISPATKPPHQYQDPDGNEVTAQRVVKATDEHSYTALLRKYGSHDFVTEAVIDGDPEIDFLNTGKILGPTNRVYVRQDGTLLHSTHFMEVVTDTDGNETRKDFVDVEATVTEDSPMRYTGKLFPKSKVLTSFALSRAIQLRHVNGLTFDFLFGIAKTLHEQDKMLFVTSGKGPLVLQRNGKPYQGFLHGKVDGESYSLVLFLSNLELKKPA